MRRQDLPVFQQTAYSDALLGLSATVPFAQTSSFGQAAQGIAIEMIAIASWVGIILCIICGIGLKCVQNTNTIQEIVCNPKLVLFFC